jgi:mycothiol synthase
MEERPTPFVTLPEVPPFPGVRFRFFQTPEDYASIASLMRAAWQADQVEATASTEEMARQYAPRPSFDPTRQLLLAEREGQIIALAQHRWMALRDGKHLYLHTHAVLPEFRGQGLEQALLHYNERCLRALAEQHREAGIPAHLHRLAWPAFVQDSEAATIALLEREGYQPVRYTFEMLRSSLEDLPHAHLPADQHLRPLAPDQYPALYAAHKEAFANAFDSTPPSEEEYQRWLQRPCMHFPDLGQVAWQGDQVTGMALCSIKQEENTRFRRQRGWVDVVCVRPAWRGQGLAAALLVHALTALRKNGMTEASLIVDTQNAHGALRLYEKIGFHPIRRRTLYDKPLE